MKEYRISRVVRLLFYIVAPLSIAATLCVVAELFASSPKESKGFLYVIITFMLVFSVFVILGAVDAWKTKYVISSAGIKRYSLDSRELLMHEIAGYRIKNAKGQDNRILLIPKEHHLKKLQISPYLERSTDIKQWLQANFKDLDTEEAPTEQKQVLTDTIYGLTTAERTRKLRSAKRTAKAINIASGIAAAWIFFLPFPYLAAFWVAVFLPLIAIGTVLKFGGLIRLVSRKSSTLPNVFIALVTTLGLIARATIDFRILDFTPVWIRMGLLAGGAIGAFVLLISRLPRPMYRKKEIILSSVLFFASWSFGTIVVFNGAYDYTQPKVYATQILDKRLNNGKNTSYHLKLTSWGTQEEAEEMTVNKQIYDETNIGETVQIYAKPGRLGIPWYWIQNENFYFDHNL